MTEWSDDRVRQTREGITAVVQPILAEQDEVKAAEIFSALADITAALIVMVTQGDLHAGEHLFVLFAQLITDRIPEYEKIRAKYATTNTETTH